MNTAASNPFTGTHALRCVHCGVVQRDVGPLFRCSQCNELLEVIYPDWEAAVATAEQFKKVWCERRLSVAPEDVSGVWRYRELLPKLDPDHVVTLGEGNTPLLRLKRSAQALGLDRLLAKHLGMNPTGSFKDSGMSAAISMARAEGFSCVCCASTGNTSASVAAYAAHAGMKSVVLLPAGQVSTGKLAQALEYGAIVLQLQTDFDGCLKLLHEVVQRFPAYLLNSVNPYRLEGQKTVSFEVAEQMSWSVPDHVVLPGGNLANCSALGKGFLELYKLGLITRVPRISVIQAEGANPLVRTMRENGGRELVRVHAETRATAIRIGNPASWRKAVAVLKATAGTCEQVSEEEIAIAKSELGAEGIGCEPASATSLAGLKKLVRSGFVKPADTVVLVLTGHMLKDTDYILKKHGDHFAGPMEPDAGAVVRRLEQMHAGN
ncbi:MAG TPA: threonine synthase [Candidatus Angelobacter sp.]|nr:threonine synthase [Candidatus Angelobacter sp.]